MTAPPRLAAGSTSRLDRMVGQHTRAARMLALVVDQGCIGVASYAVSWSSAHQFGSRDLATFFIHWIWGWGSFAILSELLLTPLRLGLARGERTLAETFGLARALNLITLSLAAAAVVLAAAGAPGPAGWVAAAGITTAATGFYAIRVAHYNVSDRLVLPWRSIGYASMSVAAVAVLTLTDRLSVLSALLLATVSLTVASLTRQQRAPVWPTLRALLPQGVWWAGSTGIRVVLYSTGLTAIIQLVSGKIDIGAYAAIFVLIAPAQFIGSALPWVFQPELARASADRGTFRRVWVRQLAFYVVLLAVMSVGLGLFFRGWVSISLGSPELRERLSDGLLATVVLAWTLVLSSWVSAAMQALGWTRALLGTIVVSGLLACGTAALGVDVLLVASVPYLVSVVVSIALTVAALQSDRVWRALR